MSCENAERQFPGPQDSLADALEGGLLADTAAVGVDATLQKERECEGTETSEWRLHSLHCSACLLRPDSGPGKNWEPQPSRAKPSLPAFYVTPSQAPAQGQALLFLLHFEKQRTHNFRCQSTLQTPAGCSGTGRGWVRRAWPGTTPYYQPAVPGQPHLMHTLPTDCPREHCQI